jgi:hypothetical protein
LVDVLDIAGFLLHDVAKDEADLNLIMFTGLPSLDHPISNAISTTTNLTSPPYHYHCPSPLPPLMVLTLLPQSNHPPLAWSDFSLLDRPVPIKENDSLLSVVRTMCNPKVRPHPTVLLAAAAAVSALLAVC